MNIYAPVCLFVFNRLDELEKTVNSLKLNALADKTDLYIFSDCWRSENEKKAVMSVRDFIHSISGFKSISIVEADKNKGLAKSIIDGVTLVFNTHNNVIVLEDDLITSANFLTYMNKSLEFYQQNELVWSVSGFCFPLDFPDDYKYDNAFSVRASSWGWGCWKNRWDLVDWDVSDFEQFSKDRIKRKAFNKGGSDMFKLLSDQMNGKINSWAIRFCYAQYKHGMYDVIPKVSKVINIGFSDFATHTRGMQSRFSTKLDSGVQVEFKFNDTALIDDTLMSQARKRFSFFTRLKYKLLGLLK